MTKRDGLSVAIKIIGLNFILAALKSVVPLIYYIVGVLVYSSPGSNDMLSMQFQYMLIDSGVLFVAFLVSAFILLKYADKITGKLIPEDKELHIFETGNWQKEVFILAARIIGLLTILEVLPGLLTGYGRSNSSSQLYFLSNSMWSDMVQRLVLLLIGVYLIAGAKSLVKLIYKDTPADVK